MATFSASFNHIKGSIFPHTTLLLAVVLLHVLSPQAIANHPAQQYVILFRDHIAKKFRAIYTYETESAKVNDKLNLLYS